MSRGNGGEYTRVDRQYSLDEDSQFDIEVEQDQHMQAGFSELDSSAGRRFGSEEDVRYYEEFSTYDPESGPVGSGKRQRGWRRKRFSLLHILFVAVGCLALFTVGTTLWNMMGRGSTGEKHSDVPQKQEPSLPPVQTSPAPDSRSRKKQLTYSNVGSLSGLVENKALDWVAHPTDASIDGLYRELRNNVFTVRKADNDTWEHPLATLDEVKKAAEGVSAGFTPLSWSVSADWEYILFNVHSERVWRHSVRGTYLLYNVHEKTMLALTASGNDRVQRVEWAPVGHRLLFVRDNDLFVSDMMHEIRVTEDGSEAVFNGLADWVYEEEVLASGASSWWAPDGEALAFLRLDDSPVPLVHFPLVHPTNHSSAYPEDVHLHYPKAGAANPQVSLHIYRPHFSRDAPPAANARDDPDTAFHPQPVRLDGAFAADDLLVTSVVWLTEGHDRLLVHAMNRVQDHEKIYLASDDTRQAAKLVRERNTQDEAHGDGAWIEVVQPAVFVPARVIDGLTADGYVEIVERDGRAHLALFSPLDAREPLRWLTQGDYDVVSGTVVVVHNSALVCFASTQTSSTEFNIYSADMGSAQLNSLSPRPAGSSASKRINAARAGTYSASFSTGGSLYVLNYRGPQLPWQAVYSVVDSSFENVLSDNSVAEKVMSEYDLPRVEFLEIPNANGDLMNAMVTYPPGFDSGARSHYGVLFRVYGGPGSQMVSRAFSLDWHSALVSQTDVPEMPWIVVSADGRGTGYRGRAWRSSVSRQLGVFEPADQAAAARYFQRQAYVNPRRIAIWGWSYGGYVTARAIEHHSDVFRVGMSVAPVTDWRFYDSVYTERYMKTPAANADGYAHSAVTNVTGFGSARYLVQHGTADDNVHLQNTLVLVDMLQAANVPGFEMATYTDSDHSIYTHGVRPALYARMTNFLFRSFHELENKEFDFWRHSDGNGDGKR
ncbi:Dpp4p [Coemansia sp. Benny D115]|nr:Dpp4p [Coemansia sp. Benny D115]